MINKFEGRYRFLSNFYPCVVEHQGISYPSNEHYYVAMKVNDEQLINGMYYTPGDFREMLATIENPAIVKRLGQKIKIRKDWDSKKLEVMNWGVREKFNNNSISAMAKGRSNTLSFSSMISLSKSSVIVLFQIYQIHTT